MTYDTWFDIENMEKKGPNKTSGVSRMLVSCYNTVFMFFCWHQFARARELMSTKEQFNVGNEKGYQLNLLGVQFHHMAFKLHFSEKLVKIFKISTVSPGFLVLPKYGKVGVVQRFPRRKGIVQETDSGRSAEAFQRIVYGRLHWTFFGRTKIRAPQTTRANRSKKCLSAFPTA